MIGKAAYSTIKLLSTHARVLLLTTFLELRKRYSGSLLGFSWVVLYPLLFLSVYLFLYLVVFNVQYPHLNTLGSIIYIFSGLVPYIAFMESANTSSTSIKQNMHLIKNVILPVELIPIRTVTIALFTQFVGLFMILILCFFNHSLSWHLLILPLAITIQFLFLLGLVLLIAPLGVMLPDTSFIINLLTLLLMFLSPIGFMAVMLPHKLHFIVDANPVYYLIEPFRFAFLNHETIKMKVLLVSSTGAIFMLLIGSALFKKCKNYLADYE